MMREYPLSKSLLYQPLSLLLSKTSERIKSYKSSVTVIEQAIHLISDIPKKNYLHINVFLACSYEPKGETSNAIRES